MPLRASCSPIQAELLSTIMPSRSSVPIAMTSHRICYPRLAVGCRALPDGRKRGGEQDFRVLLDDRTVAGRRPDALRRCRPAHFQALIEAGVGPNVQPLIEPADVRGEDADQGRQLETAG